MPAPPDGISLERHRDLTGASIKAPWLRRVLLCGVAAVPLLALLNVFGQHPTTSSASSPIASMNVTAPARLRSGLIFQVRVQVSARRDIPDAKRHHALTRSVSEGQRSRTPPILAPFEALALAHSSG